MAGLFENILQMELLLTKKMLIPDRSNIMHLIPIGIIHSPYRSKEECPIQPAYVSNSAGRVEVFGDYEAGLKDVESFSHIYLLYLFNRAGDIQLVRPTFLDDEPHGVYASRHPCRPNGIGLFIVRLERREGSALIVSGIDVLDGTPLLISSPTFRDSIL